VDSDIEDQVAKTIIVRAPISGRILQINCKESERVEKEQLILILEAMKMKNRILAPISGRVSKIFVRVDDTVKQDQELIKIDN
jgi:biotin carboxyl carrier protein